MAASGPVLPRENLQAVGRAIWPLMSPSVRRYSAGSLRALPQEWEEKTRGQHETKGLVKDGTKARGGQTGAGRRHRGRSNYFSPARSPRYRLGAAGRLWCPGRQLAVPSWSTSAHRVDRGASCIPARTSRGESKESLLSEKRKRNDQTRIRV